MKYTHEDKKLNALIGKRVKVTGINGKVFEGVLKGKDFAHGNYPYALDRSNNQEPNLLDVRFYKTHVKKIEEVE